MENCGDNYRITLEVVSHKHALALHHPNWEVWGYLCNGCLNLGARASRFEKADWTFTDVMKEVEVQQV